jgi:hypothetical protein
MDGRAILETQNDVPDGGARLMGKRMKLRVGCSPLSNRIYAGFLRPDGMHATWRDGKTDVTGEACGAVAEHVIANKAPVVVTINGVPKYELSVREL